MKVAQVIWSNQALNDLEIIYDFSAEKSLSAAQRAVESILDRTCQLESFPESGAKYELINIGSNEYRYLVEGHYKVVYSYKAQSHAVYISTIFDTRYDPEKLTI